MSDTQAATREFRFLDEKRKTNGLTEPEETRWQELAASLGIDLSAALQPAGYYGEDGLWYAYPPGYDPNAAWQQQQWDQQQQQYYPPEQGYYDPNTGAYYPPQPQQPYTPQYGQPVPQGYYDPNTGAYYPPEAYAQQPYDPAQQQYDPGQQQQYDPAQQQQWQQPAEPAPEAWPQQALATPAWEPPAPSPPAPAWQPAAPLPAAPKPSAPVFVPFSFPKPPAPAVAKPAPQPAPEVEEVGSDDVMEISDEEVLEAPGPSPTSPRPMPVAASVSSLDSVDDLRGALVDDDVPPLVSTGPSGALTSNTAITRLDAAAASVLAEVDVEPPAPAWEPSALSAPTAPQESWDAPIEDEGETARAPVKSWDAPVAVEAAAPMQSWDAPVEVETPVAVAPEAPAMMQSWNAPVEVETPMAVAPEAPAPMQWDAPVEVEAPSVIVAPEPPVQSWDAPVEAEVPSVVFAPEPPVQSWDAPVEVAADFAPEAPVQAWDAPVEFEAPAALAPEPPVQSWDAPVEFEAPEALAPEPPVQSWDAPIEFEAPAALAPEPPAQAWDAPIDAASIEAPHPDPLPAFAGRGSEEIDRMAQAIAAEPVPSSSSSWDDVPIVGETSPATIAGIPEAQPEEMILEASLEPVEAELAPVSLASGGGSAFDMLAMAPDSAPRIPTFARTAPPPPAASWAEPAPVETQADNSVFGAAWDNGEADPVLAGSPSDAVELASPSEFLTDVAVSEEISLEADLGEFVVESASAAALATNVSETGPSSIDDGKLELASNSDFIDNSQLTGTGESWSDDRSSLSLEGDDDGDVIQGMVLEEEDPVPAPDPADSWGVAVSLPAPVPIAPAPPPVAVRPPPPPAPAPPPARAVPPLREDTRVAVPISAPSTPVFQSPVPVAAPRTSVTQSAVPVAGPGTSGGASGAGASADVQPVFVPGEHRVILHTVEGQVKRGAIKDARLGEPQLLLHLATSGTETLPRERVKALFFMLAPGARAPSTEGNKVRVTFKDGRQVAGFSKDHKGATSGFFVVPADNRTNTERIFIFRHAVQSISIDS